jgi:hypothetical protein
MRATRDACTRRFPNTDSAGTRQARAAITLSDVGWLRLPREIRRSARVSVSQRAAISALIRAIRARKAIVFTAAGLAAVLAFGAGDAADLRQPDSDAAAEQRQVLRGHCGGHGG